MGVLAYRLHGPITVIAAIAAVCTCSELPDNASLGSILNFTGRTLLLSSIFAPVQSSSFEFPPTIPSMPVLQPTSVPAMVHSSPPIRTSTAITPFALQSSAVRFYKAVPTTSHSIGPQLSLQMVSYSSRLLPSVTKACPSLMLDTLSMHSDSSSLTLGLLKAIQGTSWKYPPMVQSWHAHINTHHHTTAELPFPFLRFPQTFPFEKIVTFLNGTHAIPQMTSKTHLHMWHGPLYGPKLEDVEKKLVKNKLSVAVVLLGWLGAEHRHLKKYVDWYTSRGMHAVTFVVPMKDLVTIKAGDRAEKHVDVLTQNLVQWLKDASQDDEKIIIFHTFSNTGWLTYGAVLERFINEGDEYLEKIKGCVVDSAPSARPDPQVWASGFSAALLKKNSVATQLLQSCGADDWNGMNAYPKPSLKETALLAMLEKFFSVFLQIPYVHQRLNDVVSVLVNQQPFCPQLYIYSSADTVIPAKSVESFIEEQKKAGHTVRACNFQCSPHVDHFRTFPEKYGEQLTSFLKVCVPQWVIQ